MLPRASQFVFLLALILALARPGWAATPGEIQAKIAQLEAQVEKLEKECEAVVADLEAGLFCSKCERSKVEIDKTEPFETHLDHVGGQAVPAPPELIEKKKRYYAERIAALKRRIEALRAEKITAYEEQRAEDTRRIEAERERKREDREFREIQRPRLGVSSTSTPAMTPEQQRIQGQAQLIQGVASLIDTFLRQSADRSRQRADAARAAEAAERAEAAKVAAARQRSVELEQHRQQAGKDSWLAAAKAEFGGLIKDFSGLGPSALVEEVATRSSLDLAEELAGQVLEGERPNVAAAARSAVGSEVTGFAREIAVDLLPPGLRTQVRIADAVQSWTTLNPITVWHAYDELTQKEILEQMDLITSDLPGTR